MYLQPIRTKYTYSIQDSPNSSGALYLLYSNNIAMHIQKHFCSEASGMSPYVLIIGIQSGVRGLYDWGVLAIVNAYFIGTILLTDLCELPLFFRVFQMLLVSLSLLVTQLSLLHHTASSMDSRICWLLLLKPTSLSRRLKP